MKYLLIICCFWFGCSDAMSQISKSVWMLDGTIGFSTNKGNSDITIFGTSQSIERSSWSVYLNPKVGYMISNSLMLGADLDLSSGKTKRTLSGDTNEFKNNVKYIGPFVRLYRSLREDNKMFLFAEGNYGFGNSKSESEDYISLSDITAWSVSIGIASFIGKNVALEPLIQYKSEKRSNNSGKANDNSFNFRIGLSIYLDNNVTQ